MAAEIYDRDLWLLLHYALIEKVFISLGLDLTLTHSFLLIEVRTAYWCDNNDSFELSVREFHCNFKLQILREKSRLIRFPYEESFATF